MEFSTIMKTNIDQSLINTDCLDVYLDSQEENVNLNLTWYVKSYEKRSLILQLEFFLGFLTSFLCFFPETFDFRTLALKSSLLQLL